MRSSATASGIVSVVAFLIDGSCDCSWNTTTSGDSIRIASASASISGRSEPCTFHVITLHGVTAPGSTGQSVARDVPDSAAMGTIAFLGLGVMAYFIDRNRVGMRQAADGFHNLTGGPDGPGDNYRAAGFVGNLAAQFGG